MDPISVRPLLSLKFILEDEDLRDSFRRFLASRFADENLYLYLKITAFNDAYFPSNEEMLKEANRIWETFCKPGSSHEVNLSSSLRKELAKELLDPQRNMFNRAQLAVYELMETDCYPKFLRSEEFFSIMEKRKFQLFKSTSSSSSNLPSLSSTSSINPLTPTNSFSHISLNGILSPPNRKMKLGQRFGGKSSSKLESPKLTKYQNLGTMKRISKCSPLVTSPKTKILGLNSSKSKKILKFFGDEAKENIDNHIQINQKSTFQPPLSTTTTDLE